MSDSEDIWLNSGGCRLKGGLFIPKAAADRRLPGLIYCCGFPGSDKSSQKIAEALSRDNYVSVWFDYKGVRESEGELNLVSQVDDLKAAVDYLESREEIGDKIVVVGHCFGGRVAIRVAAEDQRIKALAVWDTVGDIRDQVETLGFRISWKLYVALWVRNVHGTQGIYDKVKEAAIDLNPIDHVHKISPRPLLIIHRRKDPQAPIEHAYELERHARQPKMLIVGEGRMHSDSDSFFSSGDRKDGAIRLTLNWLKKNI
jgi:dienelactone hydrolase